MKGGFTMNKKTIIIIVAIIIIALIAGIYGCSKKQQTETPVENNTEEVREETEETEQEEPAESETNEESAQEEKSLSEQMEEELAKAGEESEITIEELEEQTGIENIAEKEELYSREYAEIEKVLTEYNRLDNTYDYRTVTLEQLLKATELLDNRYGMKDEYEKAMPKRLESIKNSNSIREFDSIEIKMLFFTDENFKEPIDIAQYSDNALTHAYVELEIRAEEKKPEKEFSNVLVQTWLQKVDGNWKVVGEALIKKLE
jgi:type IV secretory pathway VirB10-like protein